MASERPEIRAYLGLERAVAALEASDHETLADRVRDHMDEVWLLLTEEERAVLDSRAPGDFPGY